MKTLTIDYFLKRLESMNEIIKIYLSKQQQKFDREILRILDNPEQKKITDGYYTKQLFSEDKIIDIMNEVVEIIIKYLNKFTNDPDYTNDRDSDTMSKIYSILNEKNGLGNIKADINCIVQGKTADHCISKMLVRARARRADTMNESGELASVGGRKKTRKCCANPRCPGNNHCTRKTTRHRTRGVRRKSTKKRKSSDKKRETKRRRSSYRRRK